MRTQTSRRPRPRPTVVVALLAALALLLTACSGRGQEHPSTSSPSSSGRITVTGAFGHAPQLSYPIPWDSSQDTTTVLVAGKGHRLRQGRPVLLAIYAQDGSTGKVLRDDFSGIPTAYRLTADSLGSDLFDVVRGRRVGARVLHTTVSDGVTMVMTIDVLPTRARGTKVKKIPGKTSEGVPVPTITQGAGGAPVVSVDTEHDPPTSLTAIPLRRGTGAQVQAGRKAVLQYVAVRWSDGGTAGSTWTDGKLPVTVSIGADELIEGLDDALTEVAAGSRVLVIVPPDKAFAPAGGKLKDETLVYVVDVLAVEGDG